MKKLIAQYAAIRRKKSKKFSNELYADIKKNVLSAAQNQYKQLSLDWRNRQTAILKTYLWLAVTEIAAQITLFSPVWSSGRAAMLPWSIHLTFGFFCFAFFSLSTSLSVLGVDTLRGRDGIRFPYEQSYSQMLTSAYNEVEGTVQANNLYVQIIKELERAIHHQEKQSLVIGKKLRCMSWLLLLSLGFSVIALFPQNVCNFGNQPKKEVIIMPEDNRPKPKPPSDVQPAPTVVSPVVRIDSASTSEKTKK